MERRSELDVFDDAGKLILIPHTSIEQLFGIARGMEKEVHEMILSLEKEHRESALDE